MPSNTVDFFTVALYLNGKCQSKHLHLARIIDSLERFGHNPDIDDIQAKWNSPPEKISKIQGYKRVKVSFSKICNNWDVSWEISDFSPEIKLSTSVGIHKLQHPRWKETPGLIKTGEGHIQLLPIYEDYRLNGYDEVIFIGKNGEWGDSYYSNVGVLINHKLFFSLSSQYVQDGVGVKRLIDNPLISPWPVEYAELNWNDLYSNKNAKFLLLNELRGPRIIGKILDETYIIDDELMDKTTKFHHRWYNEI